MVTSNASTPTATKTEGLENSLSVSSQAQVFSGLILFALFYISVLALESARLFPGFISELLATDTTFIIRAQLAGFAVFLVLVGSELVAVHREVRLFVGPTSVEWIDQHIFAIVGLPGRWSSVLKNPKEFFAKRDVLEIILAQHVSARVSLMQVLLAAFPTSGFIGTVVGIKRAISPLDELTGSGAEQAAISSALTDVVGGLELAFNTTLVGLVMLVFGSFLLAMLSRSITRFHTEFLVSN